MLSPLRKKAIGPAPWAPRMVRRSAMRRRYCIFSCRRSSQNALLVVDILDQGTWVHVFVPLGPDLLASLRVPNLRACRFTRISSTTDAEIGLRMAPMEHFPRVAS